MSNVCCRIECGANSAGISHVRRAGVCAVPAEAQPGADFETGDNAGGAPGVSIRLRPTRYKYDKTGGAGKLAGTLKSHH